MSRNGDAIVDILTIFALSTRCADQGFSIPWKISPVGAQLLQCLGRISLSSRRSRGLIISSLGLQIRSDGYTTLYPCQVRSHSEEIDQSLSECDFLHRWTNATRHVRATLHSGRSSNQHFSRWIRIRLEGVSGSYRTCNLSGIESSTWSRMCNRSLPNRSERLGSP